MTIAHFSPIVTYDEHTGKIIFDWTDSFDDLDDYHGSDDDVELEIDAICDQFDTARNNFMQLVNDTIKMYEKQPNHPAAVLARATQELFAL